MFARFDKNPAMTLQDIKKTKCYGRTHGRMDNVKTVYPPQPSLREVNVTDGRTHGQRENSIPTTNKVCGGYKNLLKQEMCHNVTNAPKYTIFIELRPKVKVIVTQDSARHSPTPRCINTPNLGSLPQIILEICSGHNFSRNEARGQDQVTRK